MAAGSLASRGRAPTRVGDRPWSSREIRIHPIRVKTAIDRRVMVATRRLSNLLAGATGRNGAGRGTERSDKVRGAGRVVFAAIMLLIVGTLNIIYGIGALDDANIFTDDRRFVLDNLNTLGWVLIILGVIQLTGGFSLFAGNVYGRVIGIVGGSLGAIGALLSIGGAFPWWSLAIFFLCVWIVFGIIEYGGEERAAGESPRA
jgi:hypothetical protein